MRGQEGPRTDRKKNEVFISFLLHALQHARSRRTTLNGLSDPIRGRGTTHRLEILD